MCAHTSDGSVLHCALDYGIQHPKDNDMMCAHNSSGSVLITVHTANRHADMHAYTLTNTTTTLDPYITLCTQPLPYRYTCSMLHSPMCCRHLLLTSIDRTHRCAAERVNQFVWPHSPMCSRIHSPNRVTQSRRMIQHLVSLHGLGATAQVSHDGAPDSIDVGCCGCAIRRTPNRNLVDGVEKFVLVEGLELRQQPLVLHIKDMICDLPLVMHQHRHWGFVLFH